MPRPNAPTSADFLLVACLCAEWCGTCNEYRPLFEQLQKEFPQTVFRWVDIEDESDLVDPIEVDNFPTLLVAGARKVHFFGTVTPHIETLRRMIQNALESAASNSGGIENAEVGALNARLRLQGSLP